MSMRILSAKCAMCDGTHLVPSLRNPAQASVCPACAESEEEFFVVRVVTAGGAHIEKNAEYSRFAQALTRARAEAAIESLRSHPRNWYPRGQWEAVSVEVVAIAYGSDQPGKVVHIIPIETHRPASELAAA